MYLGKIVELTDKKRIYSESLHPYTKALISAIPIPDPHLKRTRYLLEGDLPNAIDPPTGCALDLPWEYAKTICKDKNTYSFAEVRSGHYVACHLY